MTASKSQNTGMDSQALQMKMWNMIKAVFYAGGFKPKHGYKALTRKK